MRVLLVEDDSNTAQSIELMLKSENFIVDSTDLGEDGLEIGKVYEYDIIILDIMLPDIDGFEVLRRLRDSRVGTPVLILSGLTEGDRVATSQLGRLRDGARGARQEYVAGIFLHVLGEGRCHVSGVVCATRAYRIFP